jgi:hypothetical protein
MSECFVCRGSDIFFKVSFKKEEKTKNPASKLMSLV